MYKIKSIKYHQFDVSSTGNNVTTPTVFKLRLEASVGWSVGVSVPLSVEKILDDSAFLLLSGTKLNGLNGRQRNYKKEFKLPVYN